MCDCRSVPVQQLIDELDSLNAETPPPSALLGEDPTLKGAMKYEWETVKQAANESWIRWREWLRGQFRQMHRQEQTVPLDSEHRRFSDSYGTATIPAYDEEHEEELVGYRQSVVFFGNGLDGECDERCHWDANRTLLRACTYQVLPAYSDRIDSEHRMVEVRGEKYPLQLDTHLWGRAVSYVVDYRLILGDAIMFAFRPKHPKERQITDDYGFKVPPNKTFKQRVQMIDIKSLFEYRLKDYAENLAKKAARGPTPVYEEDPKAPYSAAGDVWKARRNAVDQAREWVISQFPVDSRQEAGIVLDYYIEWRLATKEGCCDRLNEYVPRNTKRTIKEVHNLIIKIKRLFGQYFEQRGM